MKLRLKQILLTTLPLLLLLSFAHGAMISILNPSFEEPTLDPWFQDRSFGSFRSWQIGSINPADGAQYAFTLGRIELRQNITPAPASLISQFQFQARQQFSDNGDLWVELFYEDTTSSGQLPIAIPSVDKWETIDLVPFLDQNKNLSAVSVIGIPATTTLIDDFELTSIPEPFSPIYFLTAALLRAFYRTKV